jgi:small subunit ribosomal protein S6
MRKYETFFIMDPDMPDEVTQAADERIKGVVASQGGSVLSYEPWGKNKLAYPIKKRTRGLYVLMEYAGGPALVAELERIMRLDERVLKFITVKLDDRFDPTREEPRSSAKPAFGVEDTSDLDVSGDNDEEESDEGFSEDSESESED